MYAKACMCKHLRIYWSQKFNHFLSHFISKIQFCALFICNNLLFHLTTSYPDLHKYCNFIKALSYNIFISCNKFPLQQTNLNNKLNMVDQLWDDQWQRNEREREKFVLQPHNPPHVEYNEKLIIWHYLHSMLVYIKCNKVLKGVKTLLWCNKYQVSQHSSN